MPLTSTQVHDGAQAGPITSGGTFQPAYANASTSIAVNQYIVWRFPTFIPAGATVTNATLTLPFGVKSTSTSQSSSHTVTVHYSGNSPELTTSENMFSTRPGSGTASLTISYDQPTNTYSSGQVDITNIITPLLSHTNYVPGAYMSIFAVCNSESGDMSFNMPENGFSPRPTLDITYTLATAPTLYTDFNRLMNPSFTNDTGWWSAGGDFFGSVNPNGTLARDTSFLFQGRATMKYTCPAPNGNPAGLYTTAYLDGDKQYVFCGYVYIPSSISTSVDAVPQFHYEWYTNPGSVTARDQWVPFCTLPLDAVGTANTKWMTFTIGNGYTQGQNFWLADCAVFASSGRQRPFSAWTTAKGGTLQIANHLSYETRWTTHRGTVVRNITPKVYNHDGTSLKARPKYTQTTDGLWVP